MRLRIYLSQFCFLLILWAASGFSADWSQWRGPSRDGHSPEKGLLQAWPKDGPRLAWKTSGLGRGYSSVAVVGSRIFCMGESGENSFVSAVSRADGKSLWTTKVDRAGAPGWGGFAGPRSTVTVAGDLVFALGQYGELVCLEADSGKEKWRKNFPRDFQGKPPEWGFSESPLVDGDRLVCTPGGAQGTVLALDVKTGKTLWRSKELTDSAAYSSLIAVEIDGVPQYIQLTAASVAGLAADSGRLLWRAPRRGETAVIPTPIYHDHHVYVSSGYGVGCNLFKITKQENTFSAEQVYANKVMVNHHGGVVLVGDHVYGYSDGKGWVCQELKSGQMIWSEKKFPKGSVTYADGRLYLRAEDGAGLVGLIEPTPEGYREKGRFTQPERRKENSWAHPVVVGGKLYLRDQDLLLCYDIQAQ